jgi:hypothetical protein
MKEYKTNPIRLCWKPEAGSWKLFAKQTQFPSVFLCALCGKNTKRTQFDQSAICNFQSKIKKRTQFPAFLHQFRRFYFSIVNCTLSIPPLHGGKRTQFVAT